MKEPRAITEADLGETMQRALRRMAEYQATPQGRADALEDERRRERRRVTALHELADACGAPQETAVREAAFAPHPVGPFIDAVRELFAFARPSAAAGPLRRGKTPAVRALMSPPGAGKSVALTFAAVYSPRSSLYATAAEISRTHRAMHDNRAIWQRWVGVDLLCIDELGLGDEKPEVVIELLLDRWSAGGLTLLAGNLTMREFVARYRTGALGVRLGDRLLDQSARGLSVIVSGPTTSRRRKAGSR